MTPFEKALIQAINDDFSHVPSEEELDCPAISLRKVPKINALRHCLIAASICILLIGSVLAAYAIRYQIGEVDVETDITKILPFEVSEEYANNRKFYSLTFSETIASPNAPDSIETYYLPTHGVSAHTLIRPNFMISNTIGVYPPFSDMDFPTHFNGAYVSYKEIYPDLSQEEIHKILESPTGAHFEWIWNNDSIVRFTQYPAKEAAMGMSFNRSIYNDIGQSVVSYETIEIDEYSIFTFTVDSSQSFPDEDPKNHISHEWYWTNGEYLFLLTARCSMDEMTELFRSVKAVSTEVPYCRDESQPNKVAENFTLLKGSVG